MSCIQYVQYDLFPPVIENGAMKLTTALRRYWKPALVATTLWAALGALFTVQHVFFAISRGRPQALVTFFNEWAVVWGTWALLTPVIAYAARRLPLTELRSRRLILHLPVAISLSLTHALLVSIITPLLYYRPSLAPVRDMFKGAISSSIAAGALVYFVAVAVIYAYRYAAQSKLKERLIADTASALDDARRSLRQLAQAERRQAPSAEALAVREKDGTTRVLYSDVDWFQAEDNYVRAYSGGKSHLVRGTLADLERRLAAGMFIRVHRSAIVNVARLRRLERSPPGGHSVTLSTGAQLRLSRRYRKRVMELFRDPRSNMGSEKNSARSLAPE